MRAIVIVLAGLMLVAPLAASAPLAPGEDEQARGEVIRRAAERGDPVALEVGSTTVEATLTPNEDLVAADPAPEPRFFEGRLVDHPQREVRVSLVDGVEVAAFGAGDAVGSTVQGDTSPDAAPGERFEPPGAVPASHVGGCTQLTPHAAADPSGLVTGWTPRTLDVAYAVDGAFVDEYADWEGTALAFANLVDGFYQAAIDLEVAVLDLHSHAGPFEVDTLDEALDALQDHYGTDHATLDRENTHLFLGKEMSDAAGMANCVGGAGNPDLAYTAGEAAEETTEIGPFEWFQDENAKIAAHEIGHILGAHHHYANCAERAPTYDAFDTLAVCTVMVNDIGLSSLTMSTANKLVTRGWADAEDL